MPPKFTTRELVMVTRTHFGTFAAIAVLLTAGCGKEPRLPATPPPRNRAHLTGAQLLKLKDDRLERTVQNEVLLAVGDDLAQEVSIVGKQPDGARAVYTTLYLEDEVANGGFNQYFWNSEGKLANTALQGYELVGAVRHAEVVRKAIAVFEQERAQQEKLKRKESLQAFSDSYKTSRLGPLDDAFYALEGKEDPSKLRVRYIRQHPDQCVAR